MYMLLYKSQKSKITNERNITFNKENKETVKIDNDKDGIASDVPLFQLHYL